MDKLMTVGLVLIFLLIAFAFFLPPAFSNARMLAYRRKYDELLWNWKRYVREQKQDLQAEKEKEE